MPGRSKNTHKNSSERTLFNVLPVDPDKDVRAGLYPGLDRTTVQDLLERCSANGLSGSRIADRLTGFDLPPNQRRAWPGDDRLLELRHQIVLKAADRLELERHAAQVQVLANALGGDLLLSEVLVNRGLSEPHAALDYLYPSLKSELPRLPRFEAMEQAADELYASIQTHKKIVVVADYDADGNCAAAILRRCIELCGGSCELIQPDRVRENYGLSAKLLPRVLALAPEVVVTLDLGTSDKLQFAELTKRGIYSICVDHHPPQADKLAQPSILANPHLDPALIGWHDLCASGLTWIVALGIFERRFGAASPKALQLAQLLSSFAATGTVADVMQIKGFNRALVSVGSKEMLTSELEPFQALTTQLRNEQVTGEYLAFYVGPMLNACGRINRGTEDRPGTFPVAEFLNCRQLAEAEQLSKQLIQVNRQRQTMERHAVDAVAREALAVQLSQDIPVHFGTVLQLPDVHEGIVGLVAARTTEYMQCPMIVVTRDIDGNWKGSGRSIPGVDLNKILESLKQKNLVLGGGGHPAAIGVVVAAHLVDRFAEAFREECHNRLSTLPRWFKEYRPDLVMCVEDLIDPAQIAKIHRIASALEPCGRANEPLKILLPNVRVVSRQSSQAGHLRLTIEDGPNPARTWAHQEQLDAVAFARSPAARFLSSRGASEVFDLIVQPTFDRAQQYQGTHGGLSVQILLAQRSAFDDSLPLSNQEAASHSSSTTRRRKATQRAQTTPLFDATLEGKPPALTSAQDFYDRFGISIIRDTVQFRPTQFEFVAKQILLDRASPAENLLYRAEVAAGKTIIALLRAAQILAQDPQAKVLYLTPQIDLVRQALASVRNFTTLADNEVVEFTGQVGTSRTFRENLLSGEAKIIIGTPQTFLPFAQQHLARYGLVVLDEVHLIHGDGTKDEDSKYAYRQIVKHILTLQEKGHSIRLLAQSGTPADTAKKCRALARTLRARYERLRETKRDDTPPLVRETKRWESAELPLDTETRTHLTRLRSTYQAVYNEMINALPQWVAKPDLLPNVTALHTEVISAVAIFRKTCRSSEGKILPQRTRFLEAQERLLGALGALSAHYQKRNIAVAPQLFSALSRIAELGAIVRCFDTLRSKGRSAFMRTVTRKMLEAIYPPRDARPAAFSSCHVRLYRREGMHELLTWALTEPTARAVLTEFRKLYPGQYRGYLWSERPSYTKEHPRPWRDLLQFNEAAQTEIRKVTGKTRGKPRTPSRLDILDAILLTELTASQRVDLKETSLREILGALRAEEKVMIMVEEKFEARLLAARLNALGMKAGWYAGRSVAKRHGMRENLRAFHTGEIQILCSTSAGDTGHDIPGVSRVIRWVPITSPKKNKQSHGRAGRQPGIPGVYTVLTIADDDPDFDERIIHTIARARAAALDRV